MQEYAQLSDLPHSYPASCSPILHLHCEKPSASNRPYRFAVRSSMSRNFHSPSQMPAAFAHQHHKPVQPDSLRPPLRVHKPACLLTHQKPQESAPSYQCSAHSAQFLHCPGDYGNTRVPVPSAPRPYPPSPDNPSRLRACRSSHPLPSS